MNKLFATGGNIPTPPKKPPQKAPAKKPTPKK